MGAGRNMRFMQFALRAVEIAESHMDLNYLFYRQQIETSLAGTARSTAARKVHGELAGEYEKRIGQAAARNPEDVPKANSTMAVAITAREVESGR